MRDSQKTRKQLLNELAEARHQLEMLAAAEVERKKVGQDLKQSEEKFYKAFLSSPDMVIITSLKDGKYIEVNESFARITGYSRQELIGHTVDEFNLFVNPEEQQRMTRLLQERGSIRNEEFTFLIRSGEIRQWLCSAEIIDIDGDTCMIAVAADITELRKVEQALRESESKLAMAFRYTPQAIAITTVKDGKFIDANESFLRLTGFSHKELIGHTAGELNIWGNLADRQKIIKILHEKGRLDNQEFQFHFRSAGLHTMLISAEIINIGGEECIITSSTDVTERKKMEQALRDSEEKFSKAFTSSPNAVCLVSIDDSRFIEINGSFASFTGYTKKEIIGHTPNELNLWVNPDDMKKMTKSLQKMDRVVNTEIKSRMKSGEIRTGLFSAQTLDIGGARRMILVITDITEQVKDKEALRESEEKFSKAFRASPESIVITRLSDGAYLEVNDSFTRVFGFTREEAIGHKSRELDIWTQPGARKKMIRQLTKQGRVSNEEFQFRTKSGEIRTALFSSEQIEYDGEPCILSVTNDITEYKRMEAQALEVASLREVDRLRTELLANVSHELRTPLASIKGFATMLIDYDKRLTAEEKREYLETIDKNTDRLVELIEQLLEMSRLGTGMLSIKKSPANVINLCQTIISEARVRAPTHNFVFDLPLKLPIINIDDRRIRQVLDNVIDNAVKYSEAGTEITLSVRKTGKEMLFSVTDHGVGIPKKDLPYLFQGMFHSARGQKHGAAGAGLGLSICKGLVEAHGGKIWIESKEGVGTSCYFALPMNAAPTSDIAEMRK
jgi:PAS domain S-box-containing protein